jgi:hypothetical protein
MGSHPEVGPEQVTELYFAGGHGGVGGGDKVEYPLSNFTLHWLIREMERRNIPLAINRSALPGGTVLLPPTERKQGMLFSAIQKFTGKHVRSIESVSQVHPSVFVRYNKYPSWRPPALDGLSGELLSIDEDRLASIPASLGVST